MGCDIHIVVEVLFGCDWVGVANDRGLLTMEKPGDKDEPVFQYNWAQVGRRNYNFFSCLNGVRAAMPKPLTKPDQGLPSDASGMARMYWGDGEDWHSPAYMSLHEFFRRWCVSWPWLAGHVANTRMNGSEYDIHRLYNIAACGFDVGQEYENLSYLYSKEHKDVEYMSFDEFCKTHVRVIFWFDN